MLNMRNARFDELINRQYQQQMSPVEIAELDLLSAEITYNDRLQAGVPLNPDSPRRIERLRRRFESLKGPTL